MAARQPERTQLEHMYEVMRTITTCDERVRTEVKSGALQAACYPVRGLEGVCGAMSVALERRDRLVSTYRNLGDAIAKGLSLRAVIAEACGRVDGTCKGKGGAMHLTDLDAGLMATTGIVGSGLPIAAGLGLAAQEDGDGRVVAVTFGDGATSIGAFHEAMNLAALWRLPVVFICQNNGWGEHTPIAEYAANPDLTERARGYGMTAVRVDGFDPIATWRALTDAVASCRDGQGPVFVECVTYRLIGHTSSADYSYMPAEPLAAATARHATPEFRRWLAAEGHLPEQRLAEIDRRAEEVVDDAFAFAYASPPPGPAELYLDVFADQILAGTGVPR